jgi:hypothetical protein
VGAFNLKKLSEVEGKERYCVEIPNRFAELQNFDTEVNVNPFTEMAVTTCQSLLGEIFSQF